MIKNGTSWDYVARVSNNQHFCSFGFSICIIRAGCTLHNANANRNWFSSSTNESTNQSQIFITVVNRLCLTFNQRYKDVYDNKNKLNSMTLIIIFFYLFYDTFMRQCIRSSFALVVACHLYGIKTQPEPTLTYINKPEQNNLPHFD